MWMVFGSESCTHQPHAIIRFWGLCCDASFYVVVVQSLSRVWLFGAPWTVADQAPLSYVIAQGCSHPCTSSRWCRPAISSSVVPVSCPQCFPASGSFPMTWLFASGGQSIGVSASASVLPMNIQDWFLLGWTGWISLQSKGLSRVFSNTTVWNLLHN